jgi:hypothetical protein
MAIDSNSILNQDWYNRLIQGIKEQTNRAIRRTGSEADDPFWIARQKQAMGDLENQRQDAMRRMWESGAAVRGARERAYRAAQGDEMGIYGSAPAVVPMRAGGVNANEPPLPGEAAVDPGAFNVLPRDQAAYPLPLSGGPVKELRSAGPMSGRQVSPPGGVSFGAPKAASAALPYNPASLAHPDFNYEKEQKRLLDMQARLAELQYKSAEEDLLQKKAKRWPGFGSEALTNAPGKTWY